MNKKSIYIKLLCIIMINILIFEHYKIVQNRKINGSIMVNSSYASENISNIYISEKDYCEDMKNIVEPYINNKIDTGYIYGDENKKIYYEKYLVENSKANIVISHGYTESLDKYHEIIYYFLKNGYNVFGIEHRGHGRSDTLGLEDNTQIDVRKFSQYVIDLKNFMNEIVMPNSNEKKMFLYAHSMGGAIGAKFLEDYPEYFDGAVLSSPMLGIYTGKMPSFLAELIVKISVALGRGDNYVIGMRGYAPDYKLDRLATSSVNRYNYYHEIIEDQETFQCGGACYNWTNESMNAINEIIKYENVSKIEIPVIIFQAGNDTYVNEKGQNKFAKSAKQCELKIIKESKHELYRENDHIQKPYLETVFGFYKNLI